MSCGETLYLFKLSFLYEEDSPISEGDTAEETKIISHILFTSMNLWSYYKKEFSTESHSLCVNVNKDKILRKKELFMSTVIG